MYHASVMKSDNTTSRDQNIKSVNPEKLVECCHLHIECVGMKSCHHSSMFGEGRKTTTKCPSLPLSSWWLKWFPTSSKVKMDSWHGIKKLKTQISDKLYCLLSSIYWVTLTIHGRVICSVSHICKHIQRI